MIGTSKILRAIIYKRITDTYGDIPYKVKPNKIYEGIKTPKFDKQEQIYTSLLAELKAGRDMLNSSEKLLQLEIFFITKMLINGKN